MNDALSCGSRRRRVWTGWRHGHGRMEPALPLWSRAAATAAGMTSDADCASSGSNPALSASVTECFRRFERHVEVWQKTPRFPGLCGMAGLACQRRRENGPAGRSKIASQPDGRAAAEARHSFNQRHPELSFPVRSNEPAFPSRPGNLVATARSTGDGRSRATRSIASMASTGPSPQRAPWQADCQSGFSTSGAGVACSV